VTTGKKTALKAPKAGKPSTQKKPAKAHEARPEAKRENKFISINRRGRQDRRSGTDRRQKNISVAVEHRVCERRAKVNRRRQIDPTTCERDYTVDEIEFMNAIEQYKRTSGRMFPTCSEVLEVLQKLGYEKRPPTLVVPPVVETAPVSSITAPLTVI
jgi:hypothetical protein